MDILQQLLTQYRAHEKIVQISQWLGDDKTRPRIRISGLTGSADAFVAAALFLERPGYTLYIGADKEEAAYFQNSLANLLPKKEVHFFPDSFKSPGNFERLESSNVLQRTEIINRISQSLAEGECIVTYPEALFERVVSPGELSGSRIEIRSGESLDVDTIIEVLIEYGFTRTDFVYEPGQFSIRGGIVDIFSYGNEWPYRIELFDDEVESIRIFDPVNQLSKQNISRVSIVPNINTRFKKDQKVSLLSILPEDTVVWVTDIQQLTDRLQRCFEQAEEFARTVLPTLEEQELKSIFDDLSFLRPGEVLSDVLDFGMVIPNNAKPDLEILHHLSWSTSPQPSFNKNFNLLIENLRENTGKGLTNYLFTDNPRQIERFDHIFEDLEANVSIQPILKAIHAGFIDHELGIACYTDHQIFQRFHKYKLKRGFTKDRALNLRLIRELQPGDFVTHIDHGVGRYSGLEKININGHIQESVRLIYKNNDILYVSINSLHKIAKFSAKEGTAPVLSKLGSDAWKRLKSKTKKKVKDLASELIKLYAKRRATPGFAFPQDGYLQNELEASFLYEDTPDQLKTTQAVKEDMMASFPMDRLICGDVGFGKTEIAIRAAFKSVVAGKQVAVLVPTTILALQHYKTFRDRIGEFGATVDYINRFRTTREKKEIFAKLKEGKIDIVIGTHGLLSKDIGFKDLGLLVIDEEQKFGVAAKEKLRKLKVNVDTLTLTATPIPRTLQFSLMAARDLSVIRTPPPNRLPIHTETRIFNEELIKDSIYYEINRGGQVFFVHNRVKTLPDVAAMLRRLCPDVDIAMAHGKMEASDLETTLLDFIERRYDVLVSTNIIETGLDIPNANTIIINNAHQFGMSDLHQLRGRVGRSNRQAFCYLFSPPLSTLTSEARKRLKALEEFSELGSGINIAMRDLDIRGAGNLLGAEQSGFITDIGYETYQKILEEAILELKEGEFRDLFQEDLEKNRTFVREVQIETDTEMLIPDHYVSNIQERLHLYQELDAIEDEQSITNFATRLVDRFGPLPAEVEELFQGLRLRWSCKTLGFERLIFKNQKLRCFFVMNPQSPYYESELFQQILQFGASEGPFMGLSFKKTNDAFLMAKDGISGLDEVIALLGNIQTAVFPEMTKS